jgi:hypothetical protein
MTSDISKLVNLEILTLTFNAMVTYIPGSISCPQKLHCLHVQESPILELPVGLAALANLASLDIISCDGIAFPSDLQVYDLIVSTNCSPRQEQWDIFSEGCGVFAVFYDQASNQAQ